MHCQSCCFLLAFVPLLTTNLCLTVVCEGCAATKGCLLSTLLPRKPLILSLSLLHVHTSLLFASGCIKLLKGLLGSARPATLCGMCLHVSSDRLHVYKVSRSNSCNLQYCIHGLTPLIGLAHAKTEVLKDWCPKLYVQWLI